MDDDAAPTSDLTPKKEAKEETTDNSPSKPANPGMAKGGTPTNQKSSKGKRKLNGDDSSKTPNTAPPKKVKVENVSPVSYEFQILARLFYELLILLPIFYKGNKTDSEN